MQEWFVLTFEYSDKSGFHVCGITQNGVVASVWRAAGDGEHKVYKLTPDVIAQHSKGYPVFE